MTKIEQKGYSSEDLYDLVFAVGDKYLETINNNGVSDQLNFLRDNGWTEEEIIKYLEQ